MWYDELGYQTYLDLEYYAKPLKGKERTLKSISEYLKGNCDLEVLLNSYGFLILKGEYEALRENYCRDYTEESRKLVGI